MRHAFFAGALAFLISSFFSSGPMEKEEVGLVREGLRRLRFRYDDEERGSAGLGVEWDIAAFGGCWVPVELGSL